jgi:hypothetical protein
MRSSSQLCPAARHALQAALCSRIRDLCTRANLQRPFSAVCVHGDAAVIAAQSAGTINHCKLLASRPYGLSLASHLLDRGMSVRIFGHPMQTWREAMPTGMKLKSEAFASNLPDPECELTLEAFCSKTRSRTRIRDFRSRETRLFPMATPSSSGSFLILNEAW